MADPYPKTQQLERGPKRPARIKATPTEWARIRGLKLGTCRCYAGIECAGRVELHHIVPRSWGGDDVPANIAPLCSRHHLYVTERRDREILERLAESLTYDEYAYCVVKLGEGALERLFGVLGAVPPSGTGGTAYPEHEKLSAVQGDSQTIGEFLDFGRWTLCRYDDRWERFVPLKIEDALAEWFGIDQDALEREKRAMLDAIREANRARCSASTSSRLRRRRQTAVPVDRVTEAAPAPPGPASVSPAEPPEELIERLRGAANYGFGNLNEDQRNLYRAAADAIESRNALLHGADVDHAALLAVGERDKADAEQFRKARAEVGLTESASVDDLIRHHRNNAKSAAAFDKVADRERDRRKIARLTETLERIAGVPSGAWVHQGRDAVDTLKSWARAVLADEEDVANG